MGSFSGNLLNIKSKLASLSYFLSLGPQSAPGWILALSGLYNGSHMEYQTWESVPLEVMSDMISRKVISGDKAMVAQVFLKKGAVVPEHHHESEQITYILEGALKFEIEGKEIVVHKGEVLSIPSNVPHRAVAMEDTLDLDIFSPIRVDWLTRNDAYLRRGDREV
jgi:quercetin dioxygenase-like cupin family protein